MRCFVILLFSLTMLAAGCAHHRLRKNTVLQAQTIADIQEQQVLDNLAMFVANPGATAFYALPTGGSTTTGQKNGLSTDLDWNSTRFTGLRSSSAGELSLQENWTLKPINEPERLELMKCLYQRVTHQDQGIACQDCEHKLTNFFKNEIEACPIPTDFFQICKDRPPRKGGCHIKFGRYRDTYVWVSPDQFEALSRLTIAVLDIATITTSDLAKRITHEKSVPKVQLTESFIAKIDDTPRLIQANYELSVEDFQRLQKDGSIGAGSLSQLLSGDLPNTTEGHDDRPGIKSKNIQILSPSSDKSSGKDRRETGSSLESLLHSSNAAAQ